MTLPATFSPCARPAHSRRERNRERKLDRNKTPSLARTLRRASDHVDLQLFFPHARLVHCPSKPRSRAPRNKRPRPVKRETPSSTCAGFSETGAAVSNFANSASRSRRVLSTWCVPRCPQRLESGTESTFTDCPWLSLTCSSLPALFLPLENDVPASVLAVAGVRLTLLDLATG